MYYCNSEVVQKYCLRGRNDRADGGYYIKGGDVVKLKLSKSRAIGPQLCEQLCASIAAGDVKPGQRLMSVREIAMNLGEIGRAHV